MELTKDEKDVLKTLVEIELKEIKEEGKDQVVVNSPVLSSISRTRETDLPFMKTRLAYEEFLVSLLKKL